MTTWGSGATLVGGAMTANLKEFYIFGATDAGKNLVTGSTNTATLLGSAAYGTDSLGSYVGIAADNDGLRIANSEEPVFTTSECFMLVFTKEGAWAVDDTLIDQDGRYHIYVAASDFQIGSNVDYSVNPNQSVIASSTEFSLLWDAGAGKFYATGQSTPVDTTPIGNVNTGALSNLYIGRHHFDGYSTIMRARAYARWSTGSGISESDFQSIVDTPRQLIGGGGSLLVRQRAMSGGMQELRGGMRG